MTDDRTPAQAGAWALLRDRHDAGDIGGSNDGGVWTLTFECRCGESSMRPTIVVFLDLLAAMNVLAWQHGRAFGCSHVWRTGAKAAEADQAFAFLAVKIWRDEYGVDPDVWALS